MSNAKNDLLPDLNLSGQTTFGNTPGSASPNFNERTTRIRRGWTWICRWTGWRSVTHIERH